SDELEAAMGAQSVGRFGVSDGRVSLSLDDMQIGLILAIGGCEVYATPQPAPTWTPPPKGAPQPAIPEGWRKPGPVTPNHPMECLIVVEAWRQTDGDWFSNEKFLSAHEPIAWMPDTPENRAMIEAGKAT
ncbi:hypothetical protein, partial [Sphingomonas sp.]|uniref:hypothetical protein n=1 Tax=Sphingomonas sp. TaxID=28214 RepID=UPI0035663102